VFENRLIFSFDASIQYTNKTVHYLNETHMCSGKLTVNTYIIILQVVLTYTLLRPESLYTQPDRESCWCIKYIYRR